jgi:ACS family glucarate transporter-like MFS transporter
LRPAAAHQGRLVTLMVALATTSYFDRTILSVAAPTLMREFHLSEPVMGTVFSAFLLSYTLCMLPSGWLADQWDSRVILTTSFLGCGALTCLLALAGFHFILAIPALLTFLVARFGFGLFAAPLFPSCARLITTWFPRDRAASIQGLVTAGAAVGSALSPALFSWWIADYGWRASFIIAGVATAILSLLWHVIAGRAPAPHRVKRSPGSRPSIVALLLHSSFRWLIFSYFCLCYFEYIFYYWIYYYLREIKHLPSGQTALAVMILMASMGVMTPLGGWVSDRMVSRFGLERGAGIVPVVGLSCSAIFLFFGVRALSVPQTVALLALAFGFATAAEAPSWAVAFHLSRENVGTAGGMLNTLGNVGGTLAPVVTPLLAAKWGWAGGLYGGGVMLVLAITSWLVLAARRYVD